MKNLALLFHSATRRNDSNIHNTLFSQKALFLLFDTRVNGFISPPNVYMSSTGLVPGSIGGYTARWCQRAV